MSDQERASRLDPPSAKPSEPAAAQSPSGPRGSGPVRRSGEFRRKSAAAFGTALLVLFVATVAALGVARLQQAGRWVDHTERVLDRLDALLLHLGEAESAERGYLITGDESALAPYETAAGRVADDTAAVRELTRDNAVQQARLDSLFPNVAAKLAELGEIVAARRSAGLDSASRILAGRGTRTSDDVRRRVLELEADERALLRTRAARLRAETRLALLAVAFGSALAIALLALINRALRRDLAEQRRVASLLEQQSERVREQAAELEQQLEMSQALAEEAEQSAQQAHEAALEAEQARVLAEESERRFRDTANRAPVMIWTSGPDAMRDWFNAPWLAFRGRTMEEERGEGWAEGVHPDDRARCLGTYHASVEARRPFSVEYRLRRHDGEYRWVLGNGTPRFGADDAFLGFIGSCFDVTAQRRASETMAFLGEAGRLASSSLQLEDTLALLVRHAVPTLADYCSVDLLTEKGEIRRVETAHVDPAKEPLVRELWTRFPYKADDRVGVAEVIRTGRPQLVPEFSDEAIAAFAREPERLALMRALGPRSYVCVPLMARGHAYGALSFVMSDSGRRYTADDLALAIELSRRAASAVDNARLYAAERDARRAAEAAAKRTDRLQRVTAALAVAVSLEDVAAAVVAAGVEALDASATALGLVSPDGSALEVVDARGYEPPLPQDYRLPLAPDFPLSDAVLRRETIMLRSAAERAERYPRAQVLPTGQSLGAFVGAPLVVGDRVLGAIALSYRGQRDFDEEDRAFVAALAALCGQAIDRTRLYQAEQRARRRAAFLGDASALLGSSLDYETTLQRTADLAVPQLSDWCAVDLLEPDDDTLRRVAVSHPDPEKLALGLELERRFPTPPEQSGTLRVTRSGRSELYPVVTDEMLVATARSPEHLEMLRRIGFTSVMIVPLRARGRALGAMTFVASAPGRHHDEDDLALAEELARRAAIAVDNARLFTDAELARDAAEGASRSKSEFLATMSHEIRTPINAIIGYTQLMEMEITGPVTPEQRAQLERVSSSGRHLLALIDDILDLAKVEAGRLVVSRKHADAARAVEHSLALVRPQAEARRIALTAHADGGRDVRYRGDEQRVEQILVNLLSNAVKFTEPGGRIAVHCAQVPDAATAALAGDGPWVAITVEDTGIGIEADKLERIFRPFEQGESGYTRVHSGTGLGLTISRRLARLMDGDLTVESTPGVGSRFTLWLPAAQASAVDHDETRLGAGERSAAPTFE